MNTYTSKFYAFLTNETLDFASQSTIDFDMKLKNGMLWMPSIVQAHVDISEALKISSYAVPKFDGNFRSVNTVSSFQNQLEVDGVPAATVNERLDLGVSVTENGKQYILDQDYYKRSSYQFLLNVSHQELLNTTLVAGDQFDLFCTLIITYKIES